MFRIVETFSGIGSQAKALENIGVEHEVVATAEWDINAIIAYTLIHHGEIDVSDYSDVTEEHITDELKKYTLSYDGKKEMNEKSLKRLPFELKKALLASIKKTRNLVSITDVKGNDIPRDVDLLTYSFPCQDLSLCGCWHGNKTGISKSVENRSGMLWEIERILLEMKKSDRELPKFLLMENVTNILSSTHIEDFNVWRKTLTDLGYFNHIYRLNAKNFGIPQKRERAYMISVLYDKDVSKLMKIQQYFTFNNLENDLIATEYRRREIKLQDILRLDYKNPVYKKEADESKPNNTPSRQKIFEDNDILYDGKKINEINVNTVTTKQDRNPNSGLVIYKNWKREKAKFRYLTPRECFLLMGFDEMDYDVIINNNYVIAKNRNLYSNEKLIKLAGNSIVVDVLEAIFKQIIEINETILLENEKESSGFKINVG